MRGSARGRRRQRPTAARGAGGAPALAHPRRAHDRRGDDHRSGGDVRRHDRDRRPRHRAPSRRASRRAHGDRRGLRDRDGVASSPTPPSGIASRCAPTACSIDARGGGRRHAGAVRAPAPRVADRAGARRSGNFIEIKQATLGRRVKAHHVGYIGDATVGEGANIGAGTVTCNFDGVRKHQTRIGARAFVGTNSSLVAPAHDRRRRLRGRGLRDHPGRARRSPGRRAGAAGRSRRAGPRGAGGAAGRGRALRVDLGAGPG